MWDIGYILYIYCDWISLWQSSYRAYLEQTLRLHRGCINNNNLTFHAQILFLYEKIEKKNLQCSVWNFWVLKRQLSKRARYYQYNCGRSPGVWLLASSQVSLSYLYVPASRCLLRVIYFIPKIWLNEGFITITPHLPCTVDIVSIVNIGNIAEHFLQARNIYRKLWI